MGLLSTSTNLKVKVHVGGGFIIEVLLMQVAIHHLHLKRLFLIMMIWQKSAHYKVIIIICVWIRCFHFYYKGLSVKNECFSHPDVYALLYLLTQLFSIMFV